MLKRNCQRDSRLSFCLSHQQDNFKTEQKRTKCIVRGEIMLKNGLDLVGDRRKDKSRGKNPLMYFCGRDIWAANSNVISPFILRSHAVDIFCNLLSWSILWMFPFRTYTETQNLVVCLQNNLLECFLLHLERPVWHSGLVTFQEQEMVPMEDWAVYEPFHFQCQLYTSGKAKPPQNFKSAHREVGWNEAETTILFFTKKFLDSPQAPSCSKFLKSFFLI